MKKFTKLSLGVLATFVATTSFASEITVWEDNNKSVGLSTAAKDFEKQFGCTVNLVERDAGAHLNDVIGMMEKKEQTPDVFIIISDKVGEAVTKNIISPTSLMKSDADKYADVAVSVFNYNHEIYAFPRSIESLVVYYNKDELAYPFETFSDYEKHAQSLKGTGKYGLIGKIDNFYFGYGLMAGFGAYIFGINSDGTFNPNDIGLNNEGTVQGLGLISKYANEFMPEKILTDDGWGLIDDMFKKGEAAAVINGPWALDGYAKSGVNYGVAPLPKLSNGKSIRPFYGVKGYAICSNSKNKELAEKFLEFANQEQYAIYRYSQIAEFPPVKEVMSNPLITNDDYANAISTQILNADPMPSIPQMGYVWGAMGDAMTKVIKEKADPKKSLDGAVKAIQDSIKAETAPKVVEEEKVIEDTEAQANASDENATEQENAESTPTTEVENSTEATEDNTNAIEQETVTDETDAK